MTNAQLAVSFPQGTLVRLSVSFTRRPTQEEIDDGTAVDIDDWQPVDPDVITAKVGKVIGGTMDAMTISDHAYADSPADIERDSVGEYHLDITAGSANVGKPSLNFWSFRFESHGTGQAAAEGRFIVDPSQFP